MMSPDNQLAGLDWKRVSYLLPLSRWVWPGLTLFEIHEAYRWMRSFWPVWWVYCAERYSATVLGVVFGTGAALIRKELALSAKGRFPR